MQLHESVTRRHRILIAAAVAAVLGKAEIRNIRPAAWTRRRPPGIRSAPVVPREMFPPEAEAEPEEGEDTACDS
jgi:hypothetical protein